MFKLNSKLKWALGIIGTIFLGALGSGVWEVALKDNCVSLGRATMTGLTFGYESVRDSTYTKIAKGRTDRTSLWAVALATNILTSVAFGGAIFAWRATRDLPRVLKATTEGKQSTKEEREQRLRISFRQIVILSRIVAFLVLLLASILLFNLLNLSYTSAAVSHFEQMLSINLPYLTDAEQKQIRSEFSQIKVREDYAKIILRLEDSAKSHGILPPKFNVW